MNKKKTNNSFAMVLESETKKRISNREYPARECASPTCKVMFTPTDKRQKYHVPQCRVNYNNDQRVIKGLQRKAHGDLAVYNESILKNLNSNLQGLLQKEFHLDQLRILKFRFDIITDMDINKQTGRTIRWCYNYGLEGISQSNSTFIIHYREKTPY